MMDVIIHSFDPARDIRSVDQVGFINLRESYLSGSTPGNVISDDTQYNGVEEPASLLGRPSDVFDAFRKAEYVQRAGSVGASAQSDATTFIGVSE